MKKIKIAKILAIIAAFVLCFSLTACNIPVVYAVGFKSDGDSTYKPIGSIVMNAEETLTVSKSTFDGIDSNVKPDWSVGEFDRFELFVDSESHEGVVTIKDNIITAANSGYTKVSADVYKNGKDPSGKKVMFKWTVNVAEIHVINEETMTPITTAQELADMNNDLNGHYILKADIDLEDWGEWTPIGRSVFYTEPSQTFFGMFVNPYGYKIKNLTVTTSKNEDKLHDFGLFGEIGDNISDKTLISGIILEDILIDVSDYESDSPYGSPTVGGIAAHSRAKITDCVVSGTIIGGGVSTGGIIGTNSGDITNCNFIGTLKIHNENIIYTLGIGGIAGYSAFSMYENRITFGLIKNCTVNADIEGIGAYAGGIIGYIQIGNRAAVENCSFTGTVIATGYAGTMIGLEAQSEGPVDFE